MTAKPAVATRAVIAMATATTVTSADAVHRVVHDDRRSRRRAMRSMVRRRPTGRAIASPVAVFVVPITSAITIAGSADGGSAQRERIGARGSERTGDRRSRSPASAARSAREDDVAGVTPSVGNETGRTAVPLRG